MKKTAKLSPSERDFLGLVAQAAFSNPFSSAREDLDLKIAGCNAGTPREEQLDCMISRVSREVMRLHSEGRADLRLYAGEDRSLMLNALLFDVFHRIAEAFDRFIGEQMGAGDRPCSVPFAREAISMLCGYGFTEPEAHRFFAIFYQLRRAHFFIKGSLIGESPCMRNLRLRLWNNVFTHDIRWYERYLWNRLEDFSTLLLGETGTGKGTAAAAIGRSGLIPFDAAKSCFTESFTRNFISINLSQFPESLIESELFGHKKGAFTGAIENYSGVFSRCSPHGAIFLDEIGDLSIPVQIKLLQVLQDRVFSPVGGQESQRFSGRVIAATNKPLDELRNRGSFRDDFYYRLCSDVIVMPPLKQRIQEDPAELGRILSSVIRRMTGENAPELVRMVGEVLAREISPGYTWPGNVRELEQAVRRILLSKHYEGDTGRASSGVRDRLWTSIEEGDLDAQGLLAAYCTLLYERFGTYEEVARRTQLDRRTVKKHIQSLQKEAH